MVALSWFSPASDRQTHQTSALHSSIWTSLGAARPYASVAARLIAEGADLALPPEALKVTLEPKGGNSAPSWPLVVTWLNC
jgi:hypothetical protein